MTKELTIRRRMDRNLKRMLRELKDKNRVHLLCPNCNAWFEPGEGEEA